MTTAFCVSSASLSGTWLFGQGGISTHATATTFRENPYSRKLNQLLAKEYRAHATYLELQRREHWDLVELLPLEEAVEHHAKAQRFLVKLIARQSSLPEDAPTWKARLQSVILQLSTNAPRGVQIRTLALILERLENQLIQAYEDIIPIAPVGDRSELQETVDANKALLERLRKSLTRQ